MLTINKKKNIIIFICLLLFFTILLLIYTKEFSNNKTFSCVSSDNYEYKDIIEKFMNEQLEEQNFSYNVLSCNIVKDKENSKKAIISILFKTKLFNYSAYDKNKYYEYEYNVVIDSNEKVELENYWMVNSYK